MRSRRQVIKKRVARKRPPAPKLLNTEFEINFKLTVGKPGVTEEEAEGYVAECIRYAAAAYVFYVPHPIGGVDTHKRKGHCSFKGVGDMKAKVTT